MKNRIPVVFIISLLLSAGGMGSAFAEVHAQRDGLFSMDVPSGWHWDEYPGEVIITFSDGKTIAIDIQMVPSSKTSLAQIKKTLKEDDDKMIKLGINAHHGTFLDEKEISLDGVYATQLDFKTAPPNVIHVTYVAFFNKGHAFTVTYGSGDGKIHSVMDDALATLKFR